MNCCKIFLISIFIFIVSVVNGQWTSTNFPSGISNIQCIAGNGSNIFTGTISHGVLLSTNNGTTWTSANNGLTNTCWVEALAISGNNIFAGTHTPELNMGVYLSTNNGSSWSATTLSVFTAVYEFAVNGSNIFAGGLYGVWLTTNNGASWTQVLNTSPQHVLSLAINGSTIFAGTDNSKVYKSTNNGASWTQVNNGLPSNAYQVQALAISGNTVYAALWGSGLYRSIDGGANWTLATNGLLLPTLVNSVIIEGSKIFAANGTISLSTDNGQSWMTVSTGLPTNSSVTALTQNGGYLYAGIFESANNCSVWKRAITDFNAQLPDAVTFDATNVDKYSATLNGSVNPHNFSTSADFEYGNSSSYGNVVSATGSPFNGASNVNVSFPLGGLNPNSTYHYRVKATSSAGISYGNDKQFTTNSSGIGSFENLKKFVLYPNPAIGTLIVDIEQSPPSQEFVCSVYDVKGQLLIQQQIQNTISEIEIASLVKGMYFLKISNQEGVAVSIFIKE